jgi:hypothetical protein
MQLSWPSWATMVLASAAVAWVASLLFDFQGGPLLVFLQFVTK